MSLDITVAICLLVMILSVLPEALVFFREGGLRYQSTGSLIQVDDLMFTLRVYLIAGSSVGVYLLTGENYLNSIFLGALFGYSVYYIGCFYFGLKTVDSDH